MQRVHLRGKDNIARRLLIYAAAIHLSLILRPVLRVGTVRQVADLSAALYSAFLCLLPAAPAGFLVIGPGCPVTWPFAGETGGGDHIANT